MTPETNADKIIIGVLLVLVLFITMIFILPLVVTVVFWFLSLF